MPIYGVTFFNALNLLFTKNSVSMNTVKLFGKNTNIFNMFIKTEFAVNLNTHKFHRGINFD